MESNLTKTFYQQMMGQIPHHSKVIINPNTHYKVQHALRLLYSNMSCKLDSAIEKGLSEDKEIEAKESIVAVANAIQYMEEIFNKCLQMEKEFTSQQIINLDLLISNREKERKLNDLLNRI